MLWLRQSTAVTVSFGPAVLNTDGVTLVTNLTGTGANQTENTSTGIRISKNGGAFAARHATAGTSTYDAFGNYLVPLDTTDTNTLGTLRMQYANAAAFCPLFQDFMVVNTALWDALFASSGGAIPNVAAAGVGGLLTGPTTANTGLADVTRLLGTAWLTPSVAGTPDVNTKTITAGAIASATFAASALDAVWSTAARTLTAGTNIVLAKGVGVTGFNDLDAAGVRGAVGLAGANLDTQLTALDADVLTRLPTASYTAPPTANANADALLDRTAGVESGLTVRQQMRLAAAALYGKASGLGGVTVTFRDTNDTVDRITATVDVSGDRSAVTLNPA